MVAKKILCVVQTQVFYKDSKVYNTINRVFFPCRKLCAYRRITYNKEVLVLKKTQNLLNIGSIIIFFFFKFWICCFCWFVELAQLNLLKIIKNKKTLILASPSLQCVASRHFLYHFLSPSLTLSLSLPYCCWIAGCPLFFCLAVIEQKEQKAARRLSFSYSAVSGGVLLSSTPEGNWEDRWFFSLRTRPWHDSRIIGSVDLGLNLRNWYWGMRN